MKILNQPTKLIYDYLDETYLDYYKCFQSGVCLEPIKTAKVLSLTSGKVIYAAYVNPIVGNMVIVELGDKVYRYAHLDSISVNKNQRIHKGVELGYVGEGLNNTNIKYIKFDILDKASDPLIWFYSTTYTKLCCTALTENPLEKLANMV